MSEERVTFFCDGTPIVGILGGPASSFAGRRPAIVMCVGFGLVKEVFLLDFARHLRKAGYVTLNIDYRTFGESGGEPRRRLIPQMQVEDVRAALSYLETRAEVDAKRLAVFGVSLGGTIAAATAALDRRVRGGVVVAAPADLERMWTALPSFASFYEKFHAARKKFVTTGEVSYVAIEKLLSNDPETVALLKEEKPRHARWHHDITFESLEDITSFSAERGIEKARGLLFVHPGADRLIESSEARSMFDKAAEPKRYVELEGARHVEVYRDEVTFARVCSEAEAWLANTL